MKKLLILVFISLTISCSDSSESIDESNNITLTEKNLEGTWRVTELNYKENNDVTINGVSTKETSETLCQDITLKYTFSNNPKVLSSNGIFRAYTSLNDLVYQTDYNALRGFLITSTWEILNSKIIFTHPDLSQDIDIISFNGNKLVLKFTYSEYDVDTVLNNTFSKNVTTNIVLEKE